MIILDDENFIQYLLIIVQFELKDKSITLTTLD